MAQSFASKRHLDYGRPPSPKRMRMHDEKKESRPVAGLHNIRVTGWRPNARRLPHPANPPRPSDAPSTSSAAVSSTPSSSRPVPPSPSPPGPSFSLSRRNMRPWKCPPGPLEMPLLSVPLAPSTPSKKSSVAHDCKDNTAERHGKVNGRQVEKIHEKMKELKKEEASRKQSRPLKSRKPDMERLVYYYRLHFLLGSPVLAARRSERKYFHIHCCFSRPGLF